MSESRQALIFNRRHTQHNWSLDVVEQSLPQTVHLATRRALSVGAEEARLASSRISCAITGSGTGGCFFFIQGSLLL